MNQLTIALLLTAITAHALAASAPPPPVGPSPISANARPAMASTSKVEIRDVSMSLAHPSVDLKAGLYPGSSQVTSFYTNHPSMASRTIVFRVDGKVVGSAMTGADGTATFNYAPSVPPAAGSYAWTATFDGDGQYAGSSAKANLTVNKDAVLITLTSSGVAWNEAELAYHFDFGGVVTLAADGSPIKADGLTVSIDVKDPLHPIPWFSNTGILSNMEARVNTDAQGRFAGKIVVPPGKSSLRIELQEDAKHAHSVLTKALSNPPATLYFWFTNGMGVIHDNTPYLGLANQQQPFSFSWADCNYKKIRSAGNFILSNVQTTVTVHVTLDASPTGRPAGGFYILMGTGQDESGATTDKNGDAVFTYVPHPGFVQLELKPDPTTGMYTGSKKSVGHEVPSGDTCNGQWLIPDKWLQ